MRDKPRIDAVILAAGASRRLGRNKLLLRVDGEPVIRKTARVFLAACPGKVIVVTGFDAARVSSALEGLPVEVVFNPQHEEGMSGSVKAALPLLREADAVLFHLGDKPFVSEATVRKVIETYLRNRVPMVVARHDDTAGHPVLVDVARYRAEMGAIDGDRGLRDMIVRHQEEAAFVAADEGAVFDLDTDEDIEQLKRRGFRIEEAEG